METLKINISDIANIKLLGGSQKTTAQQMFNSLKDKPNYLINAGMFDMGSGMTVCDTIVGGELINGGNYTNKGFAFDTGQIKPITTENAIANKCQEFLGGSPSLVWDNKTSVDSKGFSNWFLGVGLSYRIGIGVDKNNNIIISFPQNKMTLYNLADYMYNQGCSYAINLDGGGSTRVMQNIDGELVALNEPTENRAVSTWIAIYLKNNTGGDKVKVCIDAGHAKDTSGKRSFDGSLLEYEFNRDVAKRLKAHLERHNIECMYSCDVDTAQDIPLSTRVSNANTAKVDLFVSIHANAYGNTWNDAKGWECWIYKKGANAEKIANAIMAESIPYLGLNNRGIKESGNDLYVLKYTNMPAVLIEHAFYTNKEECELSKTAAFREKCAVADAKGILKYLGIKWVELVEDKTTNTASDWAKDAWEWATKTGLCDGTNPQSNITREQVIAILERFFVNYIK